MPRTRTLLIETLDSLRDPDKWNGTPDYQHGQNCIVTALFNRCVHYSVGRDVSGARARKHIRAAIAEHGVPDGCMNSRGFPDIINWNDHPTTKHADVIKVLRDAANRASWPWEKVAA